MKYLVNIISILLNLVVGASGFALGYVVGWGAIFGVAPGTEEQARGSLLILLGLTIIVLSLFIPRKRHMHLVVSAVAVVGMVWWIVIQGSVDTENLLLIYSAISVPLLVYRYKKMD